MKTNIAILSLVAITGLSVRGDIIVPGASLTGGGSVYEVYSDNGLDVDDGRWLGALIDLNITSVGPSQALLAQGMFSSLTPGHMWYAVSPDQPIDPGLVQGSTTAFHVGFAPGYEHVTEVPILMTSGAPFLLGFWIGPSPVPTSGDVFGWAELMYDGSTLHLLDSAAETTRPGIFAGRYEAIPEPSSMLLLSLAVIGLYRRMRSG